MLPDTGIDDVKKQRNAEYAKHINDPVLSSLKMEGIRLLFFFFPFAGTRGPDRTGHSQSVYSYAVSVPEKKILTLFYVNNLHSP
jgi:hypothetical protein